LRQKATKRVDRKAAQARVGRMKAQANHAVVRALLGWHTGCNYPGNRR
jgi:prolyl-tRNA editing enzyme YbaK/EbsC (Cys-tRNA(Pro) deacylase)